MQKMMTSSIVFAGIVPHPPIMVPEVGGTAATEVRASLDAMREFVRRVIESRAETVIIISPHAPLDPRAFVAYGDPQLRASFADFRAPQATVEAPLDTELLDTIAHAADSDGHELVTVEGCGLDHGTAVPLYFLLRHGWRGSLVALGFTFLSDDAHIHFGASIRRAADEIGRPVAFVASGDLSHRLTPAAPAGFNPDAHLFDREVVASLRASAPERIINIDPTLRRMAAECGYRSMLVAFGATRELPPACEVLNYEAPFGVGYMVAQLA